VTPTANPSVLTGPRWSSASICARWCVYAAQGAPAREPTEEEVHRWERGRAWERIVVDGVVARMASEGRRPRRQETIRWPIDDPVGTGHADLYVPHEHTFVEVVSTARGALPAHKAIQVAGYTLNHPNATDGFVDSIDTHTGVEHVYPIDVDGLADRVHAIEAQVVAGMAGELPDRVCRTPWDGPAQWCPHVDHCFADWERTPLDELLATVDEADAVERLADADGAVAAAKSALDSALIARDEIRQVIAPLVEPGVEAYVGDIRVRRGNDYAKRTFGLAAFLDSGHPVPDIMWPYITESIVAGRWTVKRPRKEDA